MKLYNRDPDATTLQFNLKMNNGKQLNKMNDNVHWSKAMKSLGSVQFFMLTIRSNNRLPVKQ